MPTQALYHWSVAGSGIDVLLDLALVDLLRVACTSSSNEIGGILLGHFDGKYTVVTNFEAVESEHRRGTAYTLSKRDESRMGARLEARRRNKAEVPVGFFRSHLRPGLFLDEGDNNVISSFFPNANQVALLVRPAPDRTAVGGFFFWEDGEINRKQTYLPFPMSSHELEAGNFPLVEPVASSAEMAGAPLAESANLPFNFDTAETLDASLPVAATLLSERNPPEPNRRRNLETQSSKPSNPDRRRSWQLVAVIAGAAAFGGYLIGTSGSNRDKFGSRAGDITLNSQPDPPAPVPAPPPPSTAPKPAAPAPAVTASASAATGNPPITPVIGPAPSKPLPAITPEPVREAAIGQPAPPVQQTPLAPVPAKVVTSKRTVPPSTNVNPPAGQPQPQPPNPENWQHFHPAQPTSASEVASAEPPPAPAPEPIRAVPHAAPIATSSVSLEAVESGSVSRAISKIPGFGAFHHAKSGDDFTPPQAVRSAAPAVPADLARELTGTLPVDLRLKVDSSGHVSSVEILSHQTAAEFVRLAGDAAYDWQFQPARLKDKAVASDVIAHFKFRPSL